MTKAFLDLTGEWEFKEYPLSARRIRDLDPGRWQKTSVPCSIFNSLISAGQIKQSDIDTYPEKFSWVSDKPWVYRKIFDVPAGLLDCDRVDLVFEGLDTIANIWLNGKLIGKTNNMFIPFRFDITELLKQRDNLLLVKFEPPVQHAKKLMSRYTSFSESEVINPYRVYIRKAQYQFGWDWCPRLPGCGIWRPVRLEGIEKARLADLHIRTVDCNHRYADIKIAVKLETVVKEEFLCNLTLSEVGKTTEHKLTFSKGEDFQSTLIRIENPALWWPAGYGGQNLYQVNVQLLSGDKITDQMQKEFGIRTVKLNRSAFEPRTGAKQSSGERFQLEINGQPVFARGANWIPASIFAGAVTGEDYEKLLGAAEKANINMLRVWAGGYYEADEFYRLCDRMGIMVWQDFMFTCAYYPDRQWFLTEVKTEAAEIIKQLRNHPCLVLWCGNNEIDWIRSIGKLGRSKKFYGRTIYHKLLPQLVAELDSDRDYIPTTPFGSVKDPNDPNCGTVHKWDVWMDYRPIRKYQCQPEDVPPFVTEFGLQSLPNMETIKRFCPVEQLRIGSLPIERHNYQLDGNNRLYRYIGELFGTAGNLEQFVYLSQITQARAVKTYVEHLRAHNFRNSGVLFWQFNDCCPAISWSAIDYTKKPKALYYYARRFFAELLIAVVPEFRQPRHNLPLQVHSINVIAVNDSNQPLTATLNCRLIDLFGHLLDQVAFPIAIGPFGTSAPLKLPKALVFPDRPDKSGLHLVMDRNGEKITENFSLYLPDKYIDWPDVQIARYLLQIDQNKWKLTLKSNAVAKDVQISTAAAAQFSDNFIDLMPSDELEITIDYQQQADSIESGLQLRSVKSVFQTG